MCQSVSEYNTYFWPILHNYLWNTYVAMEKHFQHANFCDADIEYTHHPYNQMGQYPESRNSRYANAIKYG